MGFYKLIPFRGWVVDPDRYLLIYHKKLAAKLIAFRQWEELCYATTNPDFCIRLSVKNDFFVSINRIFLYDALL